MAKTLEIKPEGKHIERFWKRVKKQKNDCWVYTGFRDKDGYGLHRVKDKKIRTHRLSWYLSNGKIPQGLLVLHKCDNPSCVNPEHLFLGTARDNSKDMKEKNRQAFGTRNNGCKLCEKQVLAIKKQAKETNNVRYLSSKLANKYGVCHHTIRNIITGRSWNHLLCEN